jgi:mannitol-1-phosphate 5-dehydrogenase
MKKAVQIGAGSIGRGFLADLYARSGYEIVFVEVAPEIVAALDERGSYEIELAKIPPERTLIENVRAVDGRSAEDVAREFADADLAGMAVGVPNVDKVLPILARALETRFRDPDAPPLNMLVSENMLGAAGYVKRRLLELVPADVREAVRAKFGAVDLEVSRMVPIMDPEVHRRDPLAIRVEPYYRLPADRKAFVGPVPEVYGLEPVDNIEAYQELKLFTHNMLHALCAYLGELAGLEYVYESQADPAIRPVMVGALWESAEVLVRRWGLERAGLVDTIEEKIRRTGSRALADQNRRVGRDPIRKLGYDERLVRPARLALELGICPANLITAIAAGYAFARRDDERAVELQGIVRDVGIERAVERVSGLGHEGRLARAVARRWRRIAHER